MLAGVIASQEAVEHSGISPYVFGGVGLAGLIALLVITWMIKVER